jgi:class 3 adenylate cyclase/tetratricopeptide (TPR) repeat protein
MENASAYLSWDRRLSLGQGLELPSNAYGAVLFADISGFTAITNALVRRYGARRGADEWTRRLNAVYSALIAEVERYGGSVIGFSGDAITCWYAAALPVDSPVIAAPALRAAASALAMQQAMKPFQNADFLPAPGLRLALKTSVAAGLTHRCCVGDPAIQLIDVLAGQPLDRVAAADVVAQQGELVLDGPTARAILDALVVREWRIDATGAQFAIVAGMRRVPKPSPPAANLPVAEHQARHWVLPAIYQRLNEEQGRFLAELRPATALFLRFSGLDYDHDPQATKKLDVYIRWVQGVINRFEGALIQLTTGDKGNYLYAAFGAPLAHDDDTDRAVAAALELRRTPPPFSFITGVQIGISQGMMRTGAYGSPTRRTYGVLSDETIFAARLMTYAAPGQILVSQAVAETVADGYQVEALGLVNLKGWAAAQPVWALHGADQRPVAQGFHRYNTPLVGREAEIAVFTLVLSEVLNGDGRIVRLEGEAGVGKSHLGATFAALAAERGLTVVRARCQSTNQDVAYAAARQLLRDVLHLQPESNEAVQITRIEETLRTHNPDWLVRMPLLGDLLGLAIADNPTTAAFEPRLRQEALISLVIEVICAEARRQPHLLLFEDIHWMDEASQGVLLGLGRMVATAPLLMLLLHRPSAHAEDRFLAEVSDLPNQVRIALHELPPDGLAELVRQRLQGNVDPLALAIMQRQTQGNPFFAEELVDALCDGGHIVRDAAEWRLAAPIVAALHNAGCLIEQAGEIRLADDAPLSAVEMGLPSTVQGIVLSRLDRLPEAAKLTLKVASVIGAVFEYDLLAQAHPSQMNDLVLTEQLALLLARDFARIETPEPRAVYGFKHNITQEVAYQTLLEDQRQELHLSVARVMEQLDKERHDDLAFHFARANLDRRSTREKALHYLNLAGQRAKRDYANETALSYFNRALALEARWPWLKAKIEILHTLGRRDDERDTLALLQAVPNAPRFDTALLWGDYYEAISEYELAQQAIQPALAEARRLADAEGEARCLARLGMIAWRQGNYETAERAYLAALRVIGNDERFHDEEADVRYGLGLVYRQQGKYEAARSQFERNLMLIRQLGDRQAEAKTLNALGGSEHIRRNFQAAIHFYQQALQIRREIGDRAGVAASLFNIAQTLGNLGDYGQAEALLREVLDIQLLLNDRWWQVNTWNELGTLYLFVGDLAEAKRCLETGLSLSRTIGAETLQAYLLCNLGQVLRERGELTEAEVNLQTALALAEAQNDAQLEAICHSELALANLPAAPARAIAHAQRSLAKFKALQLEMSTTADLGTLAIAHLLLGDYTTALAYAQETLAILTACDGDGPDFPQRDYWVCHQVFQALGEQELARHALQAAYRLVQATADKINDPAMRQSYLQNMPHNRAILAAVAQNPPVAVVRCAAPAQRTTSNP